MIFSVTDSGDCCPRNDTVGRCFTSAEFESVQCVYFGIPSEEVKYTL